LLPLRAFALRRDSTLLQSLRYAAVRGSLDSDLVRYGMHRIRRQFRGWKLSYHGLGGLHVHDQCEEVLFSRLTMRAFALRKKKAEVFTTFGGRLHFDQFCSAIARERGNIVA
jgi:hypothetical protein